MFCRLLTAAVLKVQLDAVLLRGQLAMCLAERWEGVHVAYLEKLSQ
jgi:hypothetical protein